MALLGLDGCENKGQRVDQGHKANKQAKAAQKAIRFAWFGGFAVL
jgi:hypothetical protein